jgi:hypothetical protein
MSNFFAKRGTKKATAKWNVYAMKASFEVSLTGDLSMVKLGGIANAEVTVRDVNFK